jgi:hypothetical protein
LTSACPFIFFNVPGKNDLTLGWGGFRCGFFSKP